MSEHPTTEQGQGGSRDEPATARLVYVMPEQGFSADDEVTIKQLWDILWGGKWIVVAITALFAIGAITYVLVAPKWYRAEVLLAPAEAKSTPPMAGQLGGLAALAGVSIGGGESAEAVATLKSRDLAREFIQSEGILSILVSDSSKASTRESAASGERESPDIRDAIEVFHDSVLRVQEDRESGLVTVIIEWTDPVLAAEWASELVRLTNERLRQRALTDAETNVSYLQQELESTNVVTLQQSIGRLLENEMQKLMLAKGNEEFAFRTVDSAESAHKPSRPRGFMVVALGVLSGGVIGVFVVFLRQGLRTDSEGLELS